MVLQRYLIWFQIILGSVPPKNWTSLFQSEGFGIQIFPTSPNVLSNVSLYSLQKNRYLYEMKGLGKIELDDPHARAPKQVCFQRTANLFSIDKCNMPKKMIRPEQGVKQQSWKLTMRTCPVVYIVDLYTSVKHCIVRTEKTAFCQDDMSDPGAYFVELGKLYSDRARLALKAKIMISYFFHAGQLTFSLQWRSWLIINRRAVAGFLWAWNL